MTERIVKAVEDDYLDNMPTIERLGVTALSAAQKNIDPDPFAKSGDEIKELAGTNAVFKRRVTGEMKKFQQSMDGSAESKKIETNIISGYNAFDVVSPPYNLDYLAKLYEVSAPHKAAVDAKVSNIVGLGYSLQETPKTKRALEALQSKGNDKKLQNARLKLDQHKEDLLQAIDDWNQEDTFAETLAKFWKDYESTGNGFLEIGRKKNGQIGFVGHIPATTMRVRRKRDGFVQIISNRAVFFRNLGDKETANPFGTDDNPNEVIHMKKYSPASGAFYGVPDIIAAQSAVAGNEFSSRFNLDYFENKAVPRHVIILKGAKLGNRAETQLLQFFETGLKGQNHRTLYIPLPGDSDESKVDLKIEPVEAGTQDSSFNNYRKANLADILMVHRVPVTKVSVSEGASLAIAKDADKTFKEQVCAPEQSNLQKKLNRVLKEFTDAYTLSLNELTLTDANTQSQIDERHIKNQIKTPNEVRATMGMNGLPDGDKVVQLKPQQAADATANRQRDAQRSAGQTDNAGQGRNPKGDGRTTP